LESKDINRRAEKPLLLEGGRDMEQLMFIAIMIRSTIMDVDDLHIRSIFSYINAQSDIAQLI
jgi:hypothetical protein